jgi:hypothetical protein
MASWRAATLPRQPRALDTAGAPTIDDVTRVVLSYGMTAFDTGHYATADQRTAVTTRTRILIPAARRSGADRRHPARTPPDRNGPTTVDIVGPDAGYRPGSSLSPSASGHTKAVHERPHEFPVIAAAHSANEPGQGRVTATVGLVVATATHRLPPQTRRSGRWRRVPMFYGTRPGHTGSPGLSGR